MVKNTRHNLLVGREHDGYAAMCRRAETADKADFLYVDEGIRVPVNWWHERKGGGGVRAAAEGAHKPATAANLQASPSLLKALAEQGFTAPAKPPAEPAGVPFDDELPGEAAA
ncbi:MAG: hypothetical protein IT562_10770 [Alphaproteobacteria bacterium]|nr:hypothetical protein [Alphaproteobacteria bacterium]